MINYLRNLQNTLENKLTTFVINSLALRHQQMSYYLRILQYTIVLSLLDTLHNTSQVLYTLKTQLVTTLTLTYTNIIDDSLITQHIPNVLKHVIIMPIQNI